MCGDVLVTGGSDAVVTRCTVLMSSCSVAEHNICTQASILGIVVYLSNHRTQKVQCRGISQCSYKPFTTLQVHVLQAWEHYHNYCAVDFIITKSHRYALYCAQ